MRPSNLSEEQAYIDDAYSHLARMRDRAESLLESMKGVDPDLEWALLRRVRALRDNPRALCFGRLDARDGETWYVGRRHVEDTDGDPLVIEWRAPVALPYYRASGRDPMGLERRRQFVVDGRRILSIGDDHFGVEGQQRHEDQGMRGRDALLLELERARSGEMIDIVATIQPEQDEVIRSDPEGILAVQGGPGSGKTAVGLHRAAYLLYGDDAMARANILVVGPNRTFLRYIAQVLPSLGESAVVQTTLLSLVPEVDGGRSPRETPQAERVKGDGRMAEVLKRALAARRQHDDRDLAVPLGVRTLGVDAAGINSMVDRVSGLQLPYATGRDVLRAQLVAALAARFEEATGVPPSDPMAFERDVRAASEFKAALDRRWPSVPPATLVAELLSRRDSLAESAADFLDESEIKAVYRRSGRAWTPSDAPLVDEAKDLIAGQTRTYGYAIVDEAQDLSPMQLRMLARRCPSGNMTLLGDLAQAIGVWGHRDWSDVLAWLPSGNGLRIAELRYGYRSPGQVLELAGRLLPEAAPDVRPTQAVRAGRSAPRTLVVTEPDLLDVLAQEVVEQSRAWPTVAVVVPSSLVEGVLVRLRSALGRSVAYAETEGLGRPVTVVAAEAAKGLEFDAVVVVEPSAIVSERPDRAAGLRLLYVALTRPTQHLSIVSSTPLPEALAA